MRLTNGEFRFLLHLYQYDLFFRKLHNHHKDLIRRDISANFQRLRSARPALEEFVQRLDLNLLRLAYFLWRNFCEN